MPSPTHKGLLACLFWQRVPIDQIDIHRPTHEARLLVTYALFYVLLSAGISLLIARHPMPLLGAASFTDDLSYLIGFKLIALLAIPLIAFYRADYRLSSLSPGWRLGPRSVIALVLGATVGLSLNLGHLGDIRAALATRSLGEVLPVLVVAVFLPLVAAAFPEELVFRGLLQTRLERILGRLWAVLLSAVLFTAWHLPSRFLLSSGVEGERGDLLSVLVGTGVPVLVVGLIFGWLWDRYRNLVLLVVVHWAVDVLPSVSSFLGLSR